MLYFRRIVFTTRGRADRRSPEPVKSWFSLQTHYYSIALLSSRLFVAKHLSKPVCDQRVACVREMIVGCSLFGCSATKQIPSDLKFVLRRVVAIDIRVAKLAAVKSFPLKLVRNPV